MRVTKIGPPTPIYRYALGYTPTPPEDDDDEGIENFTVYIPRDLGPPVVFEPSPAAVDDDDATYGETVAHDEAMQITLEEALRLERVVVLVAVNASGARTYTLEGANLPDFSDATELTLANWNATGSWTADEVTFEYAPLSTAHQYYRLIGPSEVRRWHEVNLFEAQSAALDPANDRRVWMPLSTVVGGDPELVWEDDDSLIPTLVPLETP